LTAYEESVLILEQFAEKTLARHLIPRPDLSIVPKKCTKKGRPEKTRRKRRIQGELFFSDPFDISKCPAVQKFPVIKITRKNWGLILKFRISSRLKPAVLKMTIKTNFRGKPFSQNPLNSSRKDSEPAFKPPAGKRPSSRRPLLLNQPGMPSSDAGFRREIYT
jgi:hypothetical protein